VGVQLDYAASPRDQPINCLQCHVDPGVAREAGSDWVVLLDTLKLVFGVVSSLSLGFFAARLLAEPPARRRLSLLPLLFLAVWLLLSASGRMLATLSADQWLSLASVLARYCLLLPASLLAALGLLRERERLQTMDVPTLASSCSWPPWRSS